MALGSVVLAGSVIDDAFAKKATVRFSATVDGKRMKALKRASLGLYAPTSFSVAGQTGVRRGVSRAVTANCLGNVKSLALPATVDCYGTYTEARRHGAKDWSRNNGLQVTIDSFDGSRVVGTLRGTLDANSSSDPPVTIEGGSFSVILRDVGV